MPELDRGESQDFQSSIDRTKDPTFDELAAQKRELFAELEQEAQGWSNENKYRLAHHIMLRSIDDGLGFLRRIGASQSSVRNLLVAPPVVSMHPEFSEALARRLHGSAQRLKQSWDKDDVRLHVQKGDLLTSMGSMISALRKSTSLPPGTLSPGASEKFQPDLEIRAAKEKVDDYYEHLIRQKRVRELDTLPDNRSRGLILGERNLERRYRGLTNYDSQRIKRALTGSLQRRLSLPHDQHQDLGELMRKAGVYESAVVQFLDRLKDQSVDSMWLDGMEILIGKSDKEYQYEKQLSHYRPLNVTYDTEQLMAQEALTGEISTSLTKRGYGKDRFEIARDEATQQYVVRNVAGIKLAERQGAELSLENLRPIVEIPMTYQLTPSHEQFANVYFMINGNTDEIVDSTPKVKVSTNVLDGQLFQIHEIVGHGIYFVITPDGKTTFPIWSQKAAGQVGLSGSAEHPIAMSISSLLDLNTDTNWSDERGEYDYDNKATVVGSDYYWIGKRREEDGGNPYAVFCNGENLTNRMKLSPGSFQEIQQNAGKVYVIIRNDDGSSGVLRFADGKWERSNWYESVQFDWQSTKKLTGAEIDGRSQVAFIDGITWHETKVLSQEVCEVVRVGEKIYAKIYSPGAGFQIIDEHGKLQPVSDITQLQNIDGKLVYFELPDDTPGWGVLHVGDDEFQVSGWVFPLGMVDGKVLCADTDAIGYDGDPSLLHFDLNRPIDRLLLVFGGLTQSVKLPPNTQILSNRDGILLLRYPIHGQKAWRILEYRYGGEAQDAKADLELNEDEKRKLRLLNLLESDSAEDVKQYLLDNTALFQDIQQTKERRLIEHSRTFAATINDMIKQAPRMFLDQFTAKRDQISDKKLDRIIDTLFPTLRKLTEQPSFGGGRPVPSEGSFLDARYSQEIVHDGDPREAGGKPLLKLREGVDGMFATNTLGAYNAQSRTWDRLVVPVSEAVFGPTREVTAEIPSTFDLNQIVLPKHVQGRIIPERIHGLTRRGEEVTLQAEFNVLGAATVTVPNGVDKIVYSQSIPKLPIDPEDLGEQQYARFQDDIVRRYGHELVAPVADLPEELKIFVGSIRGLAPYDRVVAIERFVREHGHYDFDNAQVLRQKQHLNITEDVEFMQERMEELSHQTPELGAKHFAGVCADFANLTVALLRASGIPSGLITGLRGRETETTLSSKHAHAIAYALWPDADGKVKLIEIDATPGPDASHTLEEAALLIGLRQPSLEEKRRQRKEGLVVVDTEAEEALSELERLIATHDIAAIKRLQNGALEQVLNTVLRHVTTSHLDVVNEALSAARYAGFDARRLLTTEQDGLAELGIHLRYALNKSRDQDMAAQPFQGQQLIHLIEDFIRRYTTGQEAVSQEEALTILERVIDVATPMLDELESRSAMAVITYLRARNMAQKV